MRPPSDLRVKAAVMLLAVSLTPCWAQQNAAQHDSPEVADNGESEPLAQVGRTIEDFTLPDYLGKEHSLSEFSEANVIVIAFLGTECPLAKVYAAQLAALSEKYSSAQVAFLGIHSNVQDTPSELGHFARNHGITFPLLKDPGNRIADRFAAQRTPEVFVLDRDRIVRYWGRIDDQFGVGYARPAVTENYLVAAIDEMIAGKPVTKPQTEPVGCHIGRVTEVGATGDITYTNQISRLIQRRCLECHRDGGIAPFAMQSYESVSGWAETMCEVVEDDRIQSAW